jgi:hypothetical protein
VELIVMGASGRTGLLRWLTTSVTDEIVRSAPCSVLLVKPSPVHAPEGERQQEAVAAEQAAERDGPTKATPAPARPIPVPQQRPEPVGAEAGVSMG